MRQRQLRGKLRELRTILKKSSYIASKGLELERAITEYRETQEKIVRHDERVLAASKTLGTLSAPLNECRRYYELGGELAKLNKRLEAETEAAGKIERHGGTADRSEITAVEAEIKENTDAQKKCAEGIQALRTTFAGMQVGDIRRTLEAEWEAASKLVTNGASVLAGEEKKAKELDERVGRIMEGIQKETVEFVKKAVAAGIQVPEE